MGNLKALGARRHSSHAAVRSSATKETAFSKDGLSAEEVGQYIRHQDYGQKIDHDKRNDLHPFKPSGLKNFLEKFNHLVVFFYVQGAGVYFKIYHDGSFPRSYCATS